MSNRRKFTVTGASFYGHPTVLHVTAESVHDVQRHASDTLQLSGFVVLQGHAAPVGEDAPSVEQVDLTEGSDAR